MTQVDHSPVVVVRSSSSSGLLDYPVKLVAPAAAADAANGLVAAAVVDAVLVQGVVEDADAVEADAAVLRRTVVNGLSVTCYLIITVTPNIEATFYQYFSSTVCHRNIAPNFQMKKVRFFLRSIFLKICMQVPMTSIIAYIK